MAGDLNKVRRAAGQPPLSSRGTTTKPIGRSNRLTSTLLFRAWQTRSRLVVHGIYFGPQMICCSWPRIKCGASPTDYVSLVLLAPWNLLPLKNVQCSSSAISLRIAVCVGVGSEEEERVQAWPSLKSMEEEGGLKKLRMDCCVILSFFDKKCVE